MRIKPLEKETATGNSAKALASPIGHLKVFRMLAHAKTTVLPVMRLGNAVLSKDQSLDAYTRELCVLLAMHLEGGRYEWVQHVDIALAVGATSEQVEAIKRLDLDAPVFGLREQAILAFARQVVEKVQVDEGVFTAAAQQLSEEQLVELIIAISFYMMLARVTEALDLDAEPAQGQAVIQSVNS